ncbi:hypothetical protein H8356DRAFT_1425181 [Neocallimastix lanati (nom. inval.)]|jgi:hypothetical protein|uniref:Chitin-binding type-1 domain-containing protein n=1 Tax=Neocallimastix californiae TaxID=1754190 RepID=A0A1Y2BI33_9FUNG|nr:hypothetical protein H8356DRAFT_1425181 [Neocallimastix sp. JGI-2020a]ORY34451.1 hypothetical protein LY90DRAFT_704988 [Neocallimastix californiae]|eukprot:ORY34451.1 hypothetical protein LY90DRAFT_704988 [Neocallimastix californiae]
MKITGLFYFNFLLVIVNFSQALRCGESFDNKKCPDKQCCSYLGYCGRSKEYCETSFGCQSKYGRCNGEEDSSSTTIITTPTPTPTSTKTVPTFCGPNHGHKSCPGDACCNEDGQCSFDLESCGAGCQEGYGFCLPNHEFNKELCLECEDCLNCDESPLDKLLCPKTCFKNGNKRNETIEIKLCSEEGIDTTDRDYFDPEQLCSQCNKCIDCTQFPDIAEKYPNACKRVSTDVSTDGTCGPQHNNKVCPSNQCCNSSGHCSVDDYSCIDDCQYGYGNCLSMQRQVCNACVQCSYCDNEFEALKCPSTCITNSYDSNIRKISYKLNKYQYKLDCPNINKLCYEMRWYGAVIFDI